MGSQGVLSTAGSLLLRDCQNASESAALPHGVCGRKKYRRSPPKLELGILPGKASADLDGGATSV